MQRFQNKLLYRIEIGIGTSFSVASRRCTVPRCSKRIEALKRNEHRANADERRSLFNQPPHFARPLSSVRRWPRARRRVLCAPRDFALFLLCAPLFNSIRPQSIRYTSEITRPTSIVYYFSAIISSDNKCIL